MGVVFLESTLESVSGLDTTHSSVTDLSMGSKTKSPKINTIDTDVCAKIVVPGNFGPSSLFVPKKGELTGFSMNAEKMVSTAEEKVIFLPRGIYLNTQLQLKRDF